MDKIWTEQELRQLVESARAVFDGVSMEEVPAPPESEWSDGGLHVDYELCGGHVSCVMSRCIEADGKLWQLNFSAPLAGSALPEDRMSEREREMCRDDMHHDFLSGVFNRRYLETVFRDELAGWAAAGRSAAVALVAIDGYGALVRRYGQPTADQVICFVANQWRKHFDNPAERIVCRLTGSTFVIGCADHTEKQLETELQAIYADMPRSCVVSVGMMHHVAFTLTAVCAGIEETDTKDWAALYSLCDKRLRDTQSIGGNRVLVV